MNLQGEVAQYSLYRHEIDAINDLAERVSARNLGLILGNLEVHDSQSNRYFETDVIIICRFRVYVVELKHWSGRIEIRPDTWIQNNSFFKRDPHIANGFKSKLLRGIWERKFPSVVPPYFESVVILTNPEAEVFGASIQDTTQNNPSFESIEHFVRYLRHQAKIKDHLITQSQCEAFKNFLSSLHVEGRPRDFIFPGYEIVERLYQHTDRAELVARRTDVRHHSLSRLRIFFPPRGADEGLRRVYHERATATISAVSQIGEHPNILKVWIVPNENNYIVEGCDWSEIGTLRNVIEREGKLPAEHAGEIIVGILQGLQAVHDEYVIHRAVDPKNILMMDGVPKLTNFDLSYQLEEEHFTVIPDLAELSRNPYTAPEIYAGQEPEATADLFSVGVILFELLTGQRPFGCSADLLRLKGGLGDEHRRKLEQVNAPELYKDVITQLVRLDPEARLGNAADVIELLKSDGSHAGPLDEVNAELEKGAEYGLYQIDGKVRYGVESQIYNGRGIRGRKVAIKLFNRDVSLQRIADELEHADAVNHPSIVKVDTYNRWSDDRLYITFDWISDRSLRTEINGGVRPSIERFQAISLQLLDAVAAIHGYQEEGQPQPLLHNDIKPDNILLDQNDRPVLIDFGAASSPHVGTYEGTNGYVAPDLCDGIDRKYCEDGDLYGLGITLQEWVCGRNNIEEDIPWPVRQWLGKAVAIESTERFPSAENMRDALIEAFSCEEPEPVIVSKVSAEGEGKKQTEIVPAEEKREEPIPLAPNPFVAYLNSLHSRNAGNENALAESQSLNDYFGLIHVSHPICETVYKILQDQQRQHVILTGHAGDGKSVIAVDLYKRYLDLPQEKPLSRVLKNREDIQFDGKVISIIKDFSEWPQEERIKLLKEMIREDGPRFFLISNTGTLLNTLREYEEDGDWVYAESQMLKAMDSVDPQEINFHDARFSIINLSMIDNIGIAEEIFQRMILPDRWVSCDGRECGQKCPIIHNVKLIQQNRDTISKRLFLVYRRMYEYGKRFTLRQLSAHLAYMITAGLNHQDVVKLSQRAGAPQFADYMFYNRFFGDNGKEIDKPALQLKVIATIQEEGLGTKLCPTWERRLWLPSREAPFSFAAEGDIGDFETLRRIGARRSFDDSLTSRQARDQIRRMMFFLHRFENSEGDSFLKEYLGSAMILNLTRWQEKPDTELTLQENSELRCRVLHVLQEYFTGVRLPESSTPDPYLFITLSRHSHEVRQSAQVVLSQYPEGDFKLALESMNNGTGGIRRTLVLRREIGEVKTQLRLDLPFLDYVIMRNEGEVGEDLTASYVDRLERFKSQLLRQDKNDHADGIMLVRLRTNHTFRRQLFSIRENRLEVIDG
jgi:serine/threonine protein kinase